MGEAKRRRTMGEAKPRRSHLPTDTVIDARNDLDADAKAVMKVAYLATLREIKELHDFSPKELINTGERLRQVGLIEVVYDPDRDQFRIELVEQRHGNAAALADVRAVIDRQNTQEWAAKRAANGWLVPAPPQDEQ